MFTGFKATNTTMTLTLNHKAMFCTGPNSKHLHTTSYSLTFILNFLPQDKILVLTKLKVFASNKFNNTKMMISVVDSLEKHGGKRRKSWLPAFSTYRIFF